MAWKLKWPIIVPSAYWVRGNEQWMAQNGYFRDYSATKNCNEVVGMTTLTSIFIAEFVMGHINAIKRHNGLKSSMKFFLSPKRFFFNSSGTILWIFHETFIKKNKNRNMLQRVRFQPTVNIANSVNFPPYSSLIERSFDSGGVK